LKLPEQPDGISLPCIPWMDVGGDGDGDVPMGD